jgi:hypothetical protein
MSDSGISSIADVNQLGNNLFVAQLAKQLVLQTPQDEIGQQVVAQITSLPWGHNIAIITK